MNLDQIIQGKSIKTKVKVIQIAEWHLKGELEVEEIVFECFKKLVRIIMIFCYPIILSRLF